MNLELYELCDADKLEQVINCNNIPFDPTTDDHDWFDQLKGILFRYSKQKVTKKGVRVTYNHAHNSIGRAYSKIGIQFIKEIYHFY